MYFSIVQSLWSRQDASFKTIWKLFNPSFVAMKVFCEILAESLIS